MKKKIVTLFVALFALLSLTCLNTLAGSSAPVIDDKAIDQKSIAIMYGIYDIDVSKYEVMVNASGTNNREFTVFGPGGVLQFGHYTLVSSESIVYVNLEFVNGYLWYCTLTNIKGKPIYNPTVSADVINQSKNILSKYQTFAAQNYAGDTSYVNTANDMLNDVSELKTTNLTSTYAKMEIKNTEKSFPLSKNQSSYMQTSTVRFFFSSNGVDYARRGLFLGFINGSLDYFSDTWNLISVGSPNLLSRQEALDLAWTTANNFNLSFISQNGSIYYVKPDLTNATIDASLSYTLRNSSELYPLWNIYYYFAKPVHGDYGIQVAIWGDTKEIMDCQSMTTLGTPDTPSPSSSNSQNIIPNNLVWIALAGTALAIAAAVLIVWKVHKPTL